MVDAADIAKALRRPLTDVDSTEVIQWELWINDAELLITNRMRRAGLGSDLATLDQDNLAYVIREAVLAQVRHPDDATQVEVAVDDGRVSRRYQSGTGRVSILPEWWDLLNPNSKPRGAFSVRPSFTPDLCR